MTRHDETERDLRGNRLEKHDDSHADESQVSKEASKLLGEFKHTVKTGSSDKVPSAFGDKQELLNSLSGSDRAHKAGELDHHHHKADKSKEKQGDHAGKSHQEKATEVFVNHEDGRMAFKDASGVHSFVLNKKPAFEFGTHAKVFRNEKGDTLVTLDNGDKIFASADKKHVAVQRAHDGKIEDYSGKLDVKVDHDTGKVIGLDIIKKGGGLIQYDSNGKLADIPPRKHDVSHEPRQEIVTEQVKPSWTTLKETDNGNGVYAKFKNGESVYAAPSGNVVITDREGHQNTFKGSVVVDGITGEFRVYKEGDDNPIVYKSNGEKVVESGANTKDKARH